MSIWSLLAYERHFESLWGHFAVTCWLWSGPGGPIRSKHTFATFLMRMGEGHGQGGGMEAPWRRQGTNEELAGPPYVVTMFLRTEAKFLKI